MQKWYKISSCKFEAKVRMFGSLGVQNQIQPWRPLTGGTDTGGTRSSA